MLHDAIIDAAQALAKDHFMQQSFRLDSLPLFATLSDDQLERIQSQLQRKSFRAGEDIFVQGAPADGLLLLLTGQAVLFQTNEDGSQTPLATVSAGQSLNQQALFAEAMQSATMRAAQPVTLLQLTRLRFNQLLRQHPDIGAALGTEDAESRSGPINPQFAEQREDEEILIQTHRHWWSFARMAWLPLILMPAMWLGAAALEAQAPSLVLLALSLALPGLALLYFYLEWRNDSVIVTDQRIIRINRTILTMYRQVTQVGLDSVHEVNYELPPYDPFARIFRYGSVIVKTAGAQGNLEMALMPSPARFQSLIMENRQYFESRKAQRHHKLVRAEMQRMMSGEPADDALLSASQSADGPPKPLSGSKGFLSTRIEMSNGDIVYRKHISVWAQHTALPILIILASLAALILTFTLVGPDLRIITFPVAMIALLAGSLTYYWLDWDWRNDVYIISDDTITLVHKRPFFLENLRDQILVERIDNVESVTSGFFAALLKYGDVRMSLVGADEPKLFVKVARPQEIQQEISRRQHNKSLRRARFDAMQQRKMLGDYLGESPGGGLQAAPGQGATAAIGSDAPANSGGAHSAAANEQVLSAVNNPDRNRPPRLPTKIVAAQQKAPPPGPSLGSAPRPQRLRPSAKETRET
ncbi:MAG: cyclic nucleotide-binding domain-containing protein [Anaerolineae bacterium]|nr:cyclic nucleotide-binding domain-containing protein [Anaerolineae bacterium]